MYQLQRFLSGLIRLSVPLGGKRLLATVILCRKSRSVKTRFYVARIQTNAVSILIYFDQSIFDQGDR